MTNRDLYRAIGEIDEAFIEEAILFQPKKSPKPAIFKYGCIAACLTLVVVGFGVLHPTLPSSMSEGSPSTSKPADTAGGGAFGGADEGNVGESEDATTESIAYTLTLNTGASQSSADIDIKGHFWTDLTDSEIDSIFTDTATNYPITGTAHYSKTEDTVSLFQITSSIQLTEDITAMVQISPSEISKCYIIEGEPILSEIGGISVTAGMFDRMNDGTILYYADFKIDDTAYYVEFAGTAEDERLLTKIVVSFILGNEADFSVLNPVVPELRDEDLTISQSYEDAEFGGFVPKTIPSGFVLNSATRFINQQENQLFLSWSKGMNDVRWAVSYFDETDENRITAIEDTKNYDLALYPIPHSDSVPQALSQIVSNPIFNIDTLTLDVINARAYTIVDAGDTDGARMEFSVLYDDILVTIRTKGIPPETLFHMLTTLG